MHQYQVKIWPTFRKEVHNIQGHRNLRIIWCKIFGGICISVYGWVILSDFISLLYAGGGQDECNVVDLFNGPHRVHHHGVLPLRLPCHRVGSRWEFGTALGFLVLRYGQEPHGKIPLDSFIASTRTLIINSKHSSAHRRLLNKHLHTPDTTQSHCVRIIVAIKPNNQFTLGV